MLVQLDQTKFTQARNMVRMDLDAMRLTKPGMRFMGGSPQHELYLGRSRSNRLRRKATADSFFFHLNGIHLTEPATADGVPIARVFRRGARTDVAAGLTSQVEGVVNTGALGSSSAPGGACSWLILVLPYFGEHQSRNSRFSLAGDSGAAVVDLEGRFMGHVVGGEVSRPLELAGELADCYSRGDGVTWVTPAWVVFDHIKALTGMQPVIEATDHPLAPKEF